MNLHQPANITGHPGELLRNCVLPALQISVSQAAADLQITRQTLYRILGGEAAITPDMAIRLEKFCGLPARFWLDRQHQHQLQRLREANTDLVARIPSHALPATILNQIGAIHAAN